MGDEFLFLWYYGFMKKILIVDDVPGWRKYHEGAIRQIYTDVEIDLAPSATEANEMLYYNEEEPYDVVLTDMQMESDYHPLYAGEWLIEQIQKFKAYSATKIIAVSAAPNLHIIAEKYNVEFIPKYLCKDISVYEIIGE